MTGFDLKTTVESALRSAITTYLSKRQEPTSGHVILDRLFPKERRIRSIMGGLETSLGTTLWEKIADEIAKSNAFEILDKSKFGMPLSISPELYAILNKWKVKRETPKTNESLKEYVEELRKTIRTQDRSGMSYTRVTKGEGLDLWLKRGTTECGFDIKTVHINAGGGLKFNQTLMNWYLYRLLNDPDAIFEAKIVIPYSPFPPHTPESWWKNMGGRVYPLQPQEDVLVQDEFWDFLTGTRGAWNTILSVFEELGNTDFAEQFEKLFYPKS